VESDAGVVRRLCALLSSLPVRIVTSGSRADAVEAGLSQTFDLCFIAHGLADGNGLSLLKEALWGRGAVVGVLMSRHADLRVVQQAIDFGYSGVIQDPPDLQQLQPLLRRVFGGLADSLGSERPETVPSIAAKTDAFCELPDLRSIAELTLTQIRSVLSNFDLMRIIRAVDYPFAGKERLEYFDRDTLERVVCLVRRWSQQRLGHTDSLQMQAMPELFEELRRPA
jgi:CheY-like chemotaxis protein